MFIPIEFPYGEWLTVRLLLPANPPTMHCMAIMNDIITGIPKIPKTVMMMLQNMYWLNVVAEVDWDVVKLLNEFDVMTIKLAAKPSKDKVSTAYKNT